MSATVGYKHPEVPWNGLTVTDLFCGAGGSSSGPEPISLDVDDAGFRMLEPHEIQAGMGFAPDYLLLGSKRDKVKQAGNAVTPPAARDLGHAVAEFLLAVAA